MITGQTDSRNSLVEERILIDSVDDIYQHAEQLKAIVARYEGKKDKTVAA